VPKKKNWSEGARCGFCLPQKNKLAFKRPTVAKKRNSKTKVVYAS